MSAGERSLWIVFPCFSADFTPASCARIITMSPNHLIAVLSRIIS